jgi:hypothetical protein
MASRILSAGAWILWGILLVGIPITSSPIAGLLGEGISVSPFSMLPLALVLLLMLPRWLADGRKASFLVWPLLLFLLMAMLSSLIAWFRPIPEFKGQTLLSRELRALSTLAIGVGFYLMASLFPRDSREARISLGLIYLGGVLALMWSTVQADYVLRGLNNIPGDLNEIHRLFSIRDLERNRVTGMAFEPSWLGDQLIVLYLPLWLGALLKRQSLIPWRMGVLSLEGGLLLWGGWILLMTRSRVSWLALLLLGGGLAFYFLWRLPPIIARRLRLAIEGRNSSLLPIRIALLALGIVVIGLAGYFLFAKAAEIDWRMRRALRLPTEIYAIRNQHPYASLYEVANRFAFAERLIYWRAGLLPFEQYPMLGIGLGNAGFLFREGVPPYGYGLGEIRAMIDVGDPNFPNPKNLWIRLLSETGLVGFGLYISWLMLLVWLAIGLARSSKGIPGWIAIAGILSLGAQWVEGLSLDTFALPQGWLMNGLLTALILSEAQRHRAQPGNAIPDGVELSPSADSSERGDR